VTFRPAGHILGSATVQVELHEPGRLAQRVLFSGDLGRYGAPVVPDPTPVREATALLVECTYGDREHGPIAPKDALAEALLEAASRRGAVVIPSFAVGRAQELLYYLRERENERRVPILDVFVDSPMAVDATPIYARHVEEHDVEMQALLRSGARPFEPRKVHFTRAAQDSRRVNDVRQCIIISASGMVSGGRVLHHLRHRLPYPRNTILFVACCVPYCIAGTAVSGHPERRAQPRSRGAPRLRARDETAGPTLGVRGSVFPEDSSHPTGIRPACGERVVLRLRSSACI
jgi:metallo-beta-lactamase family protein